MNPSGIHGPTAVPAWPEDVRVVLLEAAGVADAAASLCPGALLLEVRGARAGVLRGPARVLAAGRPEEVGGHPAAGAARRAVLPSAVLIPGLVNAHAHLDLTSVGPQPYEPDEGFMGWIDRVRRARPSEEEDIARSVREGVSLLLAGGTVAVGDIAGAPRGRPTLTPWRTLAESPLAGVSFLEFFAMGRGEEAGLNCARATLEAAGNGRSRVRLGLQPHAPNSVSLRSYRWAAARGLPLATHLAESLAEREFICSASGPQRLFLEKIGLWDEEVRAWVGLGRRPVQHLAEVLGGAPFILAHVNDASDEDIQLLARTGQTVAYCPRASEYFRCDEDLGPHRYRDMLSAGVRVALGTDSIINLPVSAAEVSRGGISILDEMRLLYRRDRTDPKTLLAMATVHGAAALGLEPGSCRFMTGAGLLGVVAVPFKAGRAVVTPLEAALAEEDPPTLLVAPH